MLKSIASFAADGSTLLFDYADAGLFLSDEKRVQNMVAMAKAGDIRGVGVAHRKDTEYLKALPDGSENNNLGSLPTVRG